MADSNVRERFDAAVNSFIEKIKNDKNVIALILQGSLSYDTVWEKSDIDSILVVRDQQLVMTEICVNEEDIPFNVQLIERSKLKRGMERSLGGTMRHSLLTTARIVYTTDDTLYEYLEEIKQVGADDMAFALMYIAGDLAYFIEKCQKWLTVREDTEYCRFWLLKASETAANMIICLNRETPKREAVLRAKEINPELMKEFFDRPMSGTMTAEELNQAINGLDAFLESHITVYSKPVLSFMDDGDVHAMSELAKHFKYNSHAMYHFMDYLCDKGLVDKASKTIGITPKSRKIVEEMAFVKVMM